MSATTERSKKATTLALLWGAMLFAHSIRFAFGVAAPTLMALYHLSPKTMGYILSGWNWSYTGTLFLIGPIVDRFGAWIVMGVGSVVWGLSTLALPLASAAVSLFLMRMIFGFGHSMLFPAVARAVSREFSFKERTRAIAVVHSGNPLGLAAGAVIAAFVLAHLGWQAVFYCLGAGSLLWTVAWFRLYPDRQTGTPRAQGHHASSNDQRVSWLSLFRYRSTWGIALGQMGYLYAYFFFITWLPAYLVLDRKMTLLKSGVVAALPFWVGVFCTLLGGWLGDYLIASGVSLTVSRKSIIGLGLIGSTVTVIAAVFVQQAWLAVTLVTLCVAFLRTTTGSVNSLPIDLAPSSAVASLTSIQNLFGNLAGMLAPIITGYLVSATGSFVASFMVAGSMALFGAISFVFIVGNVEGHRKDPRAPLAVPVARAV
ncbi:MAG TPA: MFS transporter [Terriglobales bacterium]|nr:MFS transporter [Terriglobales bacterium]